MDFYGTLGPACQEENTLFQMFQEGMTGLRLNLSHKPLAACEAWISQMHQAAARAGMKAQLLIDLQGPELRVGQFEEPLMLEEGQLWTACQLKLPESVVPYLTEGQPVLLDDGKLLAKAVGQEPGTSEKVQDNTAEAVYGKTERMCSPVLQIVRGGRLASRKSIALPGVTVPSPTLTQADLENLQVA